MKIYLSGPIYTADTVEAREATDKWRQEVKNYIEDLWSPESDLYIQLIDPCRKKLIYNPKLFTPNEIVFRDLKDVEEADLILVNIQLLGDKLPIGTAIEIMYAWMLKKPVVIVSTDPRIVIILGSLLCLLRYLVI